MAGDGAEKGRAGSWSCPSRPRWKRVRIPATCRWWQQVTAA